MIVTNVPDSPVPGTYHDFNYLRQAGSLVSLPLTLAIIGTKRAAGTAVVGNVYQATDAATTDALGGTCSEGSINCRMAYQCSTMFGKGPLVFVTFINEPGSGTANVQTLTFAGAASSDGNVIVTVAGRPFTIGIQNGSSQSTIAAAVGNKLNAAAETLPVLVTVATNVVTFTHPTKGVNGKDVIVTIDQQIAGSVGTVATTATGAGVADHQPALDALSPRRYDGIVFSNHAAADITEILVDIAMRWAAESKTWSWYFFGEMGTIGTATSLAAAANHQSVAIANMQGCLNTAGEIATAAGMLVTTRGRANAGYNGRKVPLFPPNAATIYTTPEIKTAILAGVTPFVGVVDSTGAIATNVAQCVRMVTTRTTSTGPSGNTPDDRNRDIATSIVGVAIALQLDIAANEALGPDSNPDGVPLDDSDDLIKDLGSAILRAEAAAGVLSKRFVEADVAAIAIETDQTTIDRKNVLIPYHPNLPLGQVAWVHNVIVGG